MTTPTKEKKSAEKAAPDKTLTEAAEALHMVKAAIHNEELRLEKMAESTEESPVPIEGETAQGYYAQIMIDPAKAARIMLDYDYPIYKILQEDAPQGMWDELARMVGLETVCSVDI